MTQPPSYGTVADRLGILRRSMSVRHLELAYHVALPVAVDAGFVHLLRINFFDRPPEVLPFEAEAEVLLSPALREVGNDLYEVEPALREVLLLGLTTRFGPSRLRAVARLLDLYTDRTRSWQANAPFARAQRYTARFVLDPAAVTGILDAGGPPDRWVTVMRERCERQPPVVATLTTAISSASEAADRSAATAARAPDAAALWQSALKYLVELARLPGGDRLHVARVLRRLVVDEASMRETISRTLRVLGSPGDHPGTGNLGGLVRLLSVLDAETVHLGPAGRAVLADLITDLRAGEQLDGATVVERLREALGPVPVAPAGVGALPAAVDLLAHHLPAQGGVALHAWIDHVATQDNVDPERLGEMCRAGAAALRARTTFVMVTVRPDGVYPGRYLLGVWCQRGTEVPELIVTDDHCDDTRLGRLVSDVVETLPLAPGSPLSIEFFLASALLDLNVTGAAGWLAGAYPVVTRRLDRLPEAATRHARRRARWRSMIERGDRPGGTELVTLAAGAGEMGSAVAAGEAAVVWTRRVQPRNDDHEVLAAVVERFGPARLPEAVQEVRREAATSGWAEHPGHYLGLYWDDPERIPEDVVGPPIRFQAPDF
jgi:hypothetical protein